MVNVHAGLLLKISFRDPFCGRGGASEKPPRDRRPALEPATWPESRLWRKTAAQKPSASSHPRGVESRVYATYGLSPRLETSGARSKPGSQRPSLRGTEFDAGQGAPTEVPHILAGAEVRWAEPDGGDFPRPLRAMLGGKTALETSGARSKPGSQRPSLRGTEFDAGQGAPTEVPHILAGAEVRWAEPDGGDFPRPLRAMLGGKTALETSGARSKPGSQRPSLRGTEFDAGQGAPTEVPHILAGAEVRWAEPDGGDFPRPLRAMLGGKTALETSGARSKPGSQRPSLRGTEFDAGQGAPTEVPHILAGAEVRWAEPDGGDFPRPLRAMLGGKTALETSGARSKPGSQRPSLRGTEFDAGQGAPTEVPHILAGAEVRWAEPDGGDFPRPLRAMLGGKTA